MNEDIEGSIAVSQVRMKAVTGNDHEKKIDDIRTMLYYNISNLQLLIEKNLQKNEVKDKLDMDKLIEEMVPIYDANFTRKEIKEIIKFQKSGTGKKLQEYQALIAIESAKAISKYLEKLDSE